MIDPKSVRAYASPARASLAEVQQMADMVQRDLMDRLDFFQQAYGMTEEEATAYRDRIDADVKARAQD